MNQGHVFIITGPSGVGKNTIISHLINTRPNFAAITSYTTRPLRAEDTETGARISISDTEFRQMAQTGEFIDYKTIHNYLYGKKKSDALQALEQGRDLLFEIDVKGLPDYKKTFPNLCSIFIQYDNLNNLKKRIQLNRPDTSPDDLEIRYQTALKEMTYVDHFDHVVTNYEGHPELAIKEVEQIIDQTLAK